MNTWITPGRVLASILSLMAAGCGAGTGACGLDDPCAPGSFCDGGTCRSECDPGAPASCAVGVCTPDGRCAREQPDPAAGVCAAMVLEGDFGTPTVELLVDQSLSMDTQYSGGTRWTVLRDALIHPDTGVVTELQATERFGLTLYSNDGSGTCPDLTSVAPTLDNLGAISDVYSAASPVLYTPTGESIQAVTQLLNDFSEPGPKFIILATDGEPDTCATPNPADRTEARAMAVAAVQAAFQAGITTYVLSVGSVSQQHLQDLANAGVGYPVGGSVNAPYWEAGDATQLAAAFDAITARIMSCDLTVNGTIDPRAVDSGVIYLDGVRLAENAPDGWTAIDSTTFRLEGAACTTAKRTGAHTVTAEFGCEAAVAPVLTAEGGGAIDSGCSATGGAGAGVVLALVALLVLARRRLREVAR